MAKEQKKEAVLKIDEKEYLIDDLTKEQKVMVDHVADLERKINSSTFNLQQLNFGKQAFVDALKASLEKDSEDKE
jgi:hypothetical protein|tara:strand:- start:1877 stop:2101 length:225 start_codon:yes stop_codon:yes gene_type:complete